MPKTDFKVCPNDKSKLFLEETENKKIYYCSLCKFTHEVLKKCSGFYSPYNYQFKK